MSDSPPPALPGLSSRVFERTLSRLSQLEAQLEGLQRAHAEREDLPGTQTLLAGARLMLQETERVVVGHARTLHADPSHEAQSRFRRRVGGLLASIERALPGPLYVARKTHGREIEALVGPFTELAATNISPGRQLIFEPGDDYEFESSLLDDLIEVAATFSNQLADSLRQLPQLTVITYPAQLDGDTLLHAVISHEIAHLALDRHHGEPASIGSQLINTSLDHHFDRLLTELRSTARAAGTPTRGPKFHLLERDARRRIKKWFDELACDSLGLRMVGPAYLFALADLDLPTNRWAQRRGMPGYDTHPGLGWRLRRLVPAAKAYFETARTSEPWMHGREALADLEAVIPDDADELGVVERRIVDDALVKLEAPETIEKALGLPGIYLKGDFVTDLDVTWDKLVAGIPPAERVLSRSRSDASVETEDARQDGGDLSRGAEAEDVVESEADLSRIAPNVPGKADTARELEIDGDAAVPKYWSVPMDWRSVLNGCWVYWLAGKARDDKVRHRTMPLPATATADWREFNAFVRGTLELCGIHARLQDLRDQLDVLNFLER